MSRAWAAWVRTCWESEELGTSLALLRLFVGAIILVDFIGLFTHDVLDPLYRPLADGGLARSDTRLFWIGWLGGHSLALAEGLAAAGIVFAGAVTIGLGGRWSAFLLLQTHLGFTSLPIDIGGGYDRLLTCALFLLVLGDGCATLSADCWLRDGRLTSDRKVMAFPRMLGIYQVIVMYQMTGLGKVGRGWWPPYEALYLSFNRVPYARHAVGWNGDLYVLSQIGTVVAWWWESLFFLVGVWFLARAQWLGERAAGWAQRFDLRIPFLGIGLVTHLTLWATLNLGTFTAGTLALYVLFYSPEEWAKVFRMPTEATGERLRTDRPQHPA